MLENALQSDWPVDAGIDISQNKRKRTSSSGETNVTRFSVGAACPESLEVQLEERLARAFDAADRLASNANQEICRQEEAMQIKAQEPLSLSIVEFERLARPSTVSEQRERRSLRSSLQAGVDNALAAMTIILENLQVPDQGATDAEVQQLREIEAATEAHQRCLAILDAAKNRVTMEASRRRKDNISRSDQVVSKLAPMLGVLHGFVQQDLDNTEEEANKKRAILQPRLERDQAYIDSCIDADIAPTQDDEYTQARKSLRKTQEDLQSADSAIDVAKGRKSKAAEVSIKLEKAKNILKLKQQKKGAARLFRDRLCKHRAPR